MMLLKRIPDILYLYILYINIKHLYLYEMSGIICKQYFIIVIPRAKKLKYWTI